MCRDLERYSVMPPLNEVDVPDVATEIAATGERVPYEALIALLSEPDSARIALYLPDAWLPDGEVSTYRETYVDAWWSLLGQVDQRADFVDGDIGELGGSESRPMVVKAAHLIPALKSRGLITDRDVDAIYRGTDSGILQASIDDARQYQQVQLQDAKRGLKDIPRLQRELEDISSSKTDTIARQRWLRAQMTDQLVRDVARDMSRNETEYLMDQSSPLETQIALHALARHLRHGTMSQDQLAYIERHHKYADSIDVRHRSARALRQLYQVGAIEHEVLDRNDISLPHLSGRWSENLAQMTPEVAQLREVVAEISNSPLLAGALYPVVALGGSRLKGYGESKADIDTVVFVRPGTQNSSEFRSALANLGGGAPAVAWLEQTGEGIRLPDVEAEVGHVASDWSHVLYNMAWIGEAEVIDMLRDELTRYYHKDTDLRHLALRRLEQDTLQYRLMHKGYERQFSIQTDDVAIAPDTIDNQSVYWDLGYRRLATQLFAEKVRLPRVK